MKVYVGVDVSIHIFLASALVGDEWSRSRRCRFTPHWIAGWVGPRVGLDDAEKRKFLTLPRLEIRPLGRLVRGQSLYRLRFSALTLFDVHSLIYYLHGLQIHFL
jgi:hypothetical protein